MKHIFLVSMLVVYCSGIFISCHSGWEPLFGTDLAEADYNPEVWSIKDGVISATKDESIWTKQPYENFELMLDYKNDTGTNSGVVIYCTDKKDWIPNAVEIQIADDFDKEGVRRPASIGSNASVYGHLAPTKSNVNPAGEWNTMIVRCEGQKLTVTNNGEKVTEMDMSKWTSGTHNPDGSEIPSWLPKPYAELPTKGYIGFQGKHGQSNIYFRNIKIRSLK